MQPGNMDGTQNKRRDKIIDIRWMTHAYLLTFLYSCIFVVLIGRHNYARMQCLYSIQQLLIDGTASSLNNASLASLTTGTFFLNKVNDFLIARISNEDDSNRQGRKPSWKTPDCFHCH